MELLLGNYQGPSIIVPEPNKYYTFVYKAKTPNIMYDQHPAVICGNVFRWGFTGYNIHHQDIRQYSWGEVRTNLFELTEEEFQTIESMNTARMRSS